MGNVYKEFEDLWRTDSTIPIDEEPSQFAEMEAARIAAVRDARVATGTGFFREYVDRLDRQIGLLAPDPKMGSDVAACMTFKREGLEEAKRVLNLMVKLAEEKIPE